MSCPICFEKLNIPVSIPCGHIFCETCISQFVRSSSHSATAKCPCCRQIFNTVILDPASFKPKYQPFLLSPFRRVFVDTSTLEDELKEANLELEQMHMGLNHIEQYYIQQASIDQNALQDALSRESFHDIAIEKKMQELASARREGQQWRLLFETTRDDLRTALLNAQAQKRVNDTALRDAQIRTMLIEDQLRIVDQQLKEERERNRAITKDLATRLEPIRPEVEQQKTPSKTNFELPQTRSLSPTPTFEDSSIPHAATFSFEERLALTEPIHSGQEQKIEVDVGLADNIQMTSTILKNDSATRDEDIALLRDAQRRMTECGCCDGTTTCAKPQWPLVAHVNGTIW